MSNLDKILATTTPEKISGDPLLRRAIILGLKSADIYVTVDKRNAKQNAAGDVSLIAVMVENTSHVLLFSSKEKLIQFSGQGQRFAKVKGHDLFPSLHGQFAILNIGTEGLRLIPEDIAEINGLVSDTTAPLQGECGAPNHVHGPSCLH
ncbi:MAG: hypothetical protein ACPGVT_01935 [Maricaulaceae bacterium]